MFVRCMLAVAVMVLAVGCDSSAPAPAESRMKLGGGESAPPPPPPAAAGSVAAARPAADAAAESTAAEPVEATTAKAASAQTPAPAEATIDAERQALLDQADPKNWRTDYYAFRKNVEVVDGKISWGEMKEFDRWFNLLHATNDAMYEGIKQRDSGNKQAANNYLRLRAEAVDALKKLGTITWTARVVNNPRSSGSNTKLALPDLPAPANITFWIPKEEVERWDGVQDGDSVRFRCTFNAAGAAESPGIMVYMHLLP